jgi:hypothetical protein
MPFVDAPPSALEAMLTALIVDAGHTPAACNPLPTLLAAAESALGHIERLEAEKARLEGRIIEA